jgi:tetratricopeptide (TPR) repeat protein
LTEAEHPELAQKDALAADPWASVQRRLLGLRLLTPGDDVQTARIHRLVAAHLTTSLVLEGQRPGPKPAQGSALGSGQPSGSSPERAAQSLDTYLGQRVDALYRSQASPAEWELDALVASLPQRLAENTGHSLANDALFLTGKIITYRTLPAAATFLATVHRLLQQHAASDPANAAWQRDLSVSLDRLGDLAVAQGDLAGALRYFTEDKTIAERLADSDPSNAEWQRDLSYSCWIIAAKVFQPQERWEEALELMEQSLRIDERDLPEEREGEPGAGRETPKSRRKVIATPNSPPPLHPLHDLQRKIKFEQKVTKVTNSGTYTEKSLSMEPPYG